MIKQNALDARSMIDLPPVQAPAAWESVPEDLGSAVVSVMRNLGALAVSNPNVIADLRKLAQELLKLTEPQLVEEPVIAAEVMDATSVQEPDAPAALPVLPMPQSLPVPSVPIPTHEPLAKVSGVEVPLGWSRRTGVSNADLKLIETCCRLKAEGARWAATRQRRINAGASYGLEIEPADRDIIARAKALEDCFLWMNHASAPIPNDSGLWEDVAGCFDATAAVFGLLRQVIVDVNKNRRLFEQILDLAAEAQSALRAAVQAVGGKTDSDQDKAFNWIRQATTEEQVFVSRYLRLDDPANPTDWSDLQVRVSRVDAVLEATRRQEKEKIRLLNKAKYHAHCITNGHDAAADWAKVMGAVDCLVRDGIPASSADIRDLLLPIIDDMPEIDVPTGFQRVLVEIDRYLATQRTFTAPATRETSAEVQQVAKLYENRVMIVIGGERRSYSYEALKAAFRLKELIWITTREHESVDQFEPYVARKDVVAVLLAIRWSSHSYGDVRDSCLKHGKLFVRLPGGYNPNQVAHQILQQRGRSPAT